MFSNKRTLIGVLTLSAILILSFALAGIASAGSTTNKTVCVDGYIINHRELAVDATEFSAGLKVEAVSSAGQSFFADVDSKGYFKFETLAVGQWNFRLQLPDGWDSLVPVADRGAVAETGLTQLDEKDGCYRIVFKIRRLFDLTVIKWEELLDGTVQPGVGWDITATPVGDPYVQAQTVTTDAGGRAQFTLTSGKWYISEKVETDWKPVTPSKVVIELDQYSLPGAINPVVFKNREPACYGEIVVEKIGYGTDVNGNEIQLGPLADWKVTVVRADNTRPPITKVTDGTGRATFGDVAPGVYTVTEQVRHGWEVLSDNPQTVIHRACESTAVVFKNKETKGKLEIYGQKFLKSWEWPLKGQLIGLPGWVITATLVGTDTEVVTKTNALGEYTFTEDQLKAADMAFPGASIKVCEEVRDNWINLTPACVTIKFPYPVWADYPGAKVNFINVEDPPASAVAPVSAVAAGCRASHTVQRGETLARIASLHGCSATAIAHANGIKNVNVIRTGQVLCVP